MPVEDSDDRLTTTNRLEAFSDGVIAVIITIMVLEMKVPHGEGIETLVPVIPVFQAPRSPMSQS